MSLVPGGQAGLFSTLDSMFPYKLQSIDTQLVYTNQLLTMCTYLPHFQQRILELVISKCLELDADIVIFDAAGCSGDSPVREQEEILDGGDIFDFDDENKLRDTIIARKVDSKNAHFQVGEFNVRRRISPSAVDLAGKLDGILTLVFHFIDTQFEHKDCSRRERIFAQMLDIFERRILTMLRSKFVQFVVFYMCSKYAAYTDVFARRLLEIFMQSKHSFEKRSSAVMYLSSFFCRSLSCSAILIRYVMPAPCC